MGRVMRKGRVETEGTLETKEISGHGGMSRKRGSKRFGSWHEGVVHWTGISRRVTSLESREALSASVLRGMASLLSLYHRHENK
jgi:hypothetical protein